MEQSKFMIKIWGCRGSYPKPGKDTVIFGGNTTCFEVKIENCLLIFDAGTGIISLGQELAEGHHKTGKNITVNMFFSHIHHDHLEGLPFFEPAYFKSTMINIFGPNTFSSTLVDVISKAMLPPYFPVEFSEMNSQKTVNEVADGDTIYFCPFEGIPKLPNESTKNSYIRINVMRGYAHPKGGIFIYSVMWQDKKFVFSTDTEGYVGSDQRLVKFASKADILVHDAQFTKEVYSDPKFPRQGWGHSTVDMAVELANKAKVKKLILTHHDPNDTDDMVVKKEKYAKTIFAQAECAIEGNTFFL